MRNIRLIFFIIAYNHEENYIFIYIPNDAADDAQFILETNYFHHSYENYELSINSFETALDVADNYDEFLALCKQMNKADE